MAPIPDHPTDEYRPVVDLGTISRWFALVVILAGGSVLLGWMLGVETLKRVFPGTVSMNPLTAVALLLAGISLRISVATSGRYRSILIARSAAGVVLFIGLIKLGDYVLGWEMGIDRVLFPGALANDLGDTTNRMAPNAALSFALIGLALMSITSNSSRILFVAKSITVLTAFLSLVAVIGYFNGVSSLYGVSSYIPMAFPTAVSIVLISVGILCAQQIKSAGLLRSTTSNIPHERLGRMSKPIQNTVLAGFATALFVLCVIGIVSIRSTSELIANFRLNENKQRAVLVMERVLSEVKDAETGARGYLITGDESYLIPYQSAFADAERAVADLRSLTEEDPLQRARLEQLELLVHDRLAASTRIVEMKREHGYEAARELLLKGEGKRLMDELRTLVTEMTDHRNAQITKQTEKAASGARATTMIIAVGSVTAIVLVLLAIYFLRRDILARSRTEEALHESETRFRQLAEHIDEVFWVASGEDVIYVSPAFEKIWQRSSQWLRDNPMAWVETIVPEDRHRVEAGFRSAAEGGQFDEEYRIVRADGETRWVQARGVPVRDSEGKVYRVVGVTADITKEKDAEVELERAKAAAESANRAKTEFLANMSHEIRTPMTAIVGYTDLMLDADQPASERLNCINVIRRSGDHLLTIINDILDISKIEAGEMQVERIACSPCQVLGDVASTMRVRASDKKLRFEVKVVGPIPQTIQCDPTRLRQILINLVGNAIKFTESGWVRITMKLEDAVDGPTPRLRFEVTDSGVGIDSEELDRLFMPFTQADTSTTRRFGGSGLGLFISKRFAQLLGGDITVDSEPGRGSMFAVSVDPGPLAGIKMLSDCNEVMTNVVEPPKEHTPLELTGSILLAEDGIDNQQLLSFYLRRAGADVVMANNGLEACEKALHATAAGSPYDLILMDMQMPVMDGYAATMKLRSKGYKGPIVALTAHAMATDRQKCLNAGCTDFMSKPISRADLIAAAQKHINHHVTLPILAIEQESTFPLTPVGIDDDVIQQFLPAYLTQLPEQVRRLQTSLEDQDRQGLADVLHQLKGSSGLYGFASVAEAASRAEQCVLDNSSLATLEDQIRVLIDLIRRIKGYDEHGKSTVDQHPEDVGGDQ